MLGVVTRNFRFQYCQTKIFVLHLIGQLIKRINLGCIVHLESNHIYIGIVAQQHQNSKFGDAVEPGYHKTCS